MADSLAGLWATPYHSFPTHWLLVKTQQLQSQVSELENGDTSMLTGACIFSFIESSTDSTTGKECCVVCCSLSHFELANPTTSVELRCPREFLFEEQLVTNIKMSSYCVSGNHFPTRCVSRRDAPREW